MSTSTEHQPIVPARAVSPVGFLLKPTFLAVAMILLAGTVAINLTTDRLHLYFKKASVAQPRDFHDLPAVMGGWLQISQDKKLDSETQSTLGTDKYVFRDYIRVSGCGLDVLEFLAHPPDAASDAQSASLLGASTPTITRSYDTDAALANKFNSATFDQQVAMIQQALANKDSAERDRVIAAMQLRRPSDVITVSLTYYTGLVDTVAHIPDRCYVASGFEPSSYTQPTWDLGPDASGKDQKLGVRFISFEDQTGNQRVPRCVAYVFHADGQYRSDPLEVRQLLEDLTQRYGYYAKIELMTTGKDTDSAQDTMVSFLSAAKPQIETCFPDWDKVIGARR